MDTRIYPQPGDTFEGKERITVLAVGPGVVRFRTESVFDTVTQTLPLAEFMLALEAIIGDYGYFVGVSQI